MKKRNVALNTAAHRPAFDAFAEHFADAGRREGWRSTETLRKFLEAGARATRGILDEKPFIALHEPACGVGGMILATNAVLRENGVDVAREAHWHAVDVDYRACCGAYLQIALSDASAVVIHGNTLSLDAWSSMVTPAALFYPKRPESRPAPKPAEPAQLSLL